MMSGEPTPWRLPGLSRWLSSLEGRLNDGLAVLPSDPGRPEGADGEVRSLLKFPPYNIHPRPGKSPASELADGFGTAPKLDALLKPVLDEETAFVDLSGLTADDSPDWSTFIRRYVQERADGRPGPDLLIVNPPLEIEIPEDAIVPDWRQHLRRGDLVIWAEENLAAARDGLAADFAVELAVELCVWRLDLAAALVKANLTDLAAPIEWLERRTEIPIAGPSPDCPLSLLAPAGKVELSRRIWKAQLTAIFPDLERHRQDYITANYSRLSINDYLRNLGVHAVEEIELGALGYQLKRSLSRPMVDRLETLARARNALAHHKPVPPADVQQILQM